MALSSLAVNAKTETETQADIRFAVYKLKMKSVVLKSTTIPSIDI